MQAVQPPMRTKPATEILQKTVRFMLSLLFMAALVGVSILVADRRVLGYPQAGSRAIAGCMPKRGRPDSDISVKVHFCPGVLPTLLVSRIIRRSVPVSRAAVCAQPWGYAVTVHVMQPLSQNDRLDAWRPRTRARRHHTRIRPFATRSFVGTSMLQQVYAHHEVGGRLPERCVQPQLVSPHSGLWPHCPQFGMHTASLPGEE